MASSKTFLLLGLMFAVVTLIFSEVSALELAAAVGPIHNGGKGGAVSCRPFERNCQGRNKRPVPEHCYKDPTSRECQRHGGHERGGKEDPIHKRHGHEHGGEHNPNHGGKGGAASCNRFERKCHGHGEKGNHEPPKPCKDPTARECHKHGGLERPEHCKSNPTARECQNYGGHERGGEGDPFNHGRTKNPGKPGGPETKN